MALCGSVWGHDGSIIPSDDPTRPSIRSIKHLRGKHAFRWVSPRALGVACPSAPQRWPANVPGSLGVGR